MLRKGSLIAVILVMLAVSPPLGAQEDSGQEPDVFARSYQLDILEHEAAEALARQACPPEGRDHWCRVLNASPGSMSVTANAGTHAKIAAAIASAEQVPTSQVFQVILLQAKNNGDAGLGRIPSQARLALEDARDFLPYSGYQMLGTALLRTDNRARSIVNGPDGNDYSASLTYRDAVGRDGHRLIVQQFALDRLASARPSSEDAIERIPVIGTSFSMEPGETVIVGTSKLEGADRALVVLLTNVQ